MGVVSFFWPGSIILLVLVFAILLGWGLKSLKISKKVSILTVVVSFLLILVFTGVIGPTLVNVYNSSVLMLIGFITLVLGMVLIREAKGSKVETKKMSVLSFAFIPLFIVSIVVVICFFSVQFNLDAFSTGLTTVMSLAIFTVISYFLLDRILSLERPSVVFSDLNFFLGSGVLVLCLIMPNVLERFDNVMGGIEIASPLYLGLFVSGFIILLIVGLFITKRKNILIK